MKGKTSLRQIIRAVKDAHFQQIKRAVCVLLMVIVAGLVLRLILEGYKHNWTGFGAFTDPKGDFHREKTLWDWMELLVVPAVLAVGALLFNRAERKAELRIEDQRAQTEREISSDRLREASLQAYLDKMTELLLDKGLRESKPSDEIRTVARVRTLTVLRALDGKRKGLLLRFLHDSDMIMASNETISLSESDLSEADLSKADLHNSDLSRANLFEADLSSADLTGANLESATLIVAKLVEAKLEKANLVKANLFRANLARAHLEDACLREVLLIAGDLTEATLTGADLSEANLTRAQLTRAQVTGQQLAQAKSLKGAIMPNGTVHE